MADKKLSAHPLAVSVQNTDTVGVLQPDASAFKLRLATINQIRGRQFFSIDIGTITLPHTKTFRMPVAGKITEVRASVSTSLSSDLLLQITPAVVSVPVKIAAGQTTSTTGVQPTYTGVTIPDDTIVTIDLASTDPTCNDLQINVYYE